jgi:hypothetical protein
VLSSFVTKLKGQQLGVASPEDPVDPLRREVVLRLGVSHTAKMCELLGMPNFCTSNTLQKQQISQQLSITWMKVLMLVNGLPNNFVNYGWTFSM